MHTFDTSKSLSLSELARLLANSSKLILVSVVGGMVAGFLTSQAVHPRWAATMAIQLGQVTTVSRNGLTSQPIENQLTAADRYNTPGYRLQVLKELGLQPTGNAQANLIFDTLKATPGRGPNVVNAQVSAYSREQAAEALEAAFRAFSAAHRELFEQATKTMQDNLVSARATLNAAQQSYAMTERGLNSAAPRGSMGINSARDVLMTNLAALLSAQIVTLQQEVAVYEDALSPLRSYPTRAIGPVYVPAHSQTPSTTMFIAAGALLGFVAGAGLALLRNSGDIA